MCGERAGGWSSYREGDRDARNNGSTLLPQTLPHDLSVAREINVQVRRRRTLDAMKARSLLPSGSTSS